MKIMDFLVAHFHHIQLAIPSHKYFRLALTVAKQIVQAHKTKRKKLTDELEDIEKRTTKELDIPLIKVQLAVLVAKPTKEYPLKDNKDNVVYNYPMVYVRELYRAYERMCEIVTEVAKDYSVDIPYGSSGGTSGYFKSQATND